MLLEFPSLAASPSKKSKREGKKGSSRWDVNENYLIKSYSTGGLAGASKVSHFGLAN